MATKNFISKDQKQFKANLHSHSTVSDGALTPEEMKAAYKAKGYSILAVTDHCIPKPHPELNDPDFLTITGYEAYIRPHPKGKYNIFKPEIHMNLFARDPMNDKIICYNKCYCKYLKTDHSELNRAGSEEPREYTPEYINKFIQTAKDNGYIVAYNHPYWSMEDEETILKYEGFFSLELDNTASNLGNSLEHAEMLYDRMLRRGMRIGCHSADDNHNKGDMDGVHCDSFGSYTMILADKLEYDEIFSAIESNNCYASTGLEIYEVSITDNTNIHVECSPAAKIIVHYGAKTQKGRIAAPGETISSVDVELHPDAPYFRVTVIDENGKRACTRGFFRDEFEA